MGHRELNLRRMEREAIHQRRMRDQTRQRVDALGAENRDGRSYIAASEFRIIGGQQNGGGSLWLCTGGDPWVGTSWMPCWYNLIALPGGGPYHLFAGIEAPVRAAKDKGRRLSRVKYMYVITGLAPPPAGDDVQVRVYRNTFRTEPVGPDGPTVTQLAGFTNDTYDRDHNTAALRVAHTYNPNPTCHVGTITIPPDLRSYPDDNEVCSLHLMVDDSFGGGWRIWFYGCYLHFDETLVDLE